MEKNPPKKTYETNTSSGYCVIRKDDDGAMYVTFNNHVCNSVLERRVYDLETTIYRTMAQMEARYMGYDQRGKQLRHDEFRKFDDIVKGDYRVKNGK